MRPLTPTQLISLHIQTHIIAISSLGATISDLGRNDRPTLSGTPMRILHTSDWHIGPQLDGVSLLDDQAHVLDQIVEVVAEQGVQVVTPGALGSAA